MARIDFQKNDTYRKSFGGVLKIQKHVDSESDLPETGASEGDIYTVGESNTMMLYHNGEFKPMGSGGSVSWNDVTDKPFYTKTFPTIDLPNGIKLVIDGYVKNDAEVVDGKYLVTDTRFDITLINGSDNTVLEKSAGVAPKITGHSTSMLYLEANVRFDAVHMIYGSDGDAIMAIELSWSELDSFNEKVRTWTGYVDAVTDHGQSGFQSITVVTPAKPSAVKGEDYDSAVYDGLFTGGEYKKPDEIKKIDKEYLPDPDSSVWIKGYPGLSTTTLELEAMGLTADVIESVASGEIMKVLIGPGGKFGPPDMFNVVNRKSDDVNGSWFTCENVKFDAYGIEYTRYDFQVSIDVSDTGEEIRYPQVGDMEHYRYEIQAETESD